MSGVDLKIRKSLLLSSATSSILSNLLKPKSSHFQNLKNNNEIESEKKGIEDLSLSRSSSSSHNNLELPKRTESKKLIINTKNLQRNSISKVQNGENSASKLKNLIQTKKSKFGNELNENKNNKTKEISFQKIRKNASDYEAISSEISVFEFIIKIK